jgi:hypothetical protein
MKGSIAVGWLAGLALGLIATPLAAQSTAQQAAEILNAPADRRPAPARVTTVVIPQREIIVVERVRGRHGWWKKRGYRVVTVYYDGRRFYRRPFGRAALRQVIVYERGGRYYVDEDHWKRKHRHHNRHDD